MTLPALVIARHTLHECVRRRVFLVVPFMTMLFVGLFAWATHAAFGAVHRQSGGFPVEIDRKVLVGATLLGLAMFGSLFLGSVGAVFLTFGTIRGDAESGVLQSLLVRPLSRTQLILGRFAGAGALAAAYVTLVFLICATAVRLIGRWWPPSLLIPVVCLAGGVLVVTALSLAGSTKLAGIANGICVLALYGAGLIAGLLGQLGNALGLHTLARIGTGVSWALPFEALYQAGLATLTGPTSGFTHVVVQLGPLGGAKPGSPVLVLWTVGYVLVVGLLAVRGCARRDL